MTDFDFDCKEKKRIAQGAFHKKNGSKSKGCSLPHDGMSAKKLNGPVKTVNLDRPMKWKEFCGMPEDMQRMYLERCMELYGVSLRMLCDMFGMSRTPVYNRMAALGVARHEKRFRPSAAQRVMWETFCNGVVGGQPEPAPEEKTKQTIEQKTQTPAGTYVPFVPAAELDALRMELEFYKRAYNDLLDRLVARSA